MMNRNYSNPKKLNADHRHSQQTRKTSLNRWLGSTGFIEDFEKTVLRNCVRLHGPPGGDELCAWRMRGGEPTASSNKSAAGQQRNSIRNKTMNIRGNTENRNANSFETHAHSTMGDTKMNTRNMRSSLFNPRGLFVSVLALATVSIGVTPALADITNTATANGTFGGSPVVSSGSSQNIPVATPSVLLSVTKSTPVYNDVDLSGNYTAGDTLTYTYTIQNDGNITVNDVTPLDTAPTFDGTAGDNSIPSFTLTSASDDLAPTESATFTGVYTLSGDDIYEAAGVTDGVENVATAQGTRVDTSATYTSGDSNTSQFTIPAEPSLLLAKAFAFATDGGSPGEADVGDVITYTYSLTNNGNVPITNAFIIDAHETGEPGDQTFDSSAYAGTLGTSPGEWDMVEATPASFGSSSDGGGDAIYDTVGVGGVITFTYTHTVTQAEFDAQ